jgi:hypothetical protein
MALLTPQRQVLSCYAGSSTPYSSGFERAGNKRTGFVVGVLFLESNGFRFTATEEDTAWAILSLADGTLNEESFIRFLHQNTSVADPHGSKQDYD